MSWIDFKLGARMLVKYPGLSVIGGLTLAVAIGLGAGWFEITEQILHPRVPLADGDRIIRIENWDSAASEVEPRSLYDFRLWREQLTTVRELGVYRSSERNLITADGIANPMVVAEISPSAFPLTRVPPAKGRALIDADAELGAPDVAVISYDIWQERFNGETSVIDRTVKIGSTPTTIVGVMPKGFGFPVSHQLWVPLRLTDAGPRQSQEIHVFGRLADGASLESAQTELSGIGDRVAAASPATHARLRPRVLPYAAPAPGMEGALVLQLSNIIGWLILAAACANVATLLFARTASREAELVVRTALGASRARVMMQLVVEALVLAAVAAVAGLTAAHFALDYVVRLVVASEHNARLPFWWEFGIGLKSILYAIFLTIGGALMVAVLPALKATGQRVQAALTTSGSGGASMRFGGVWSFMIVLQVATATLCLPIGVVAAVFTLDDQLQRSDYPIHELLMMRPELDPDSGTGPQAEKDEQRRARFSTVFENLRRRLEAESGVTGVTYGTTLPALSASLRQVEAQRGSEPPFLVDANIEGDRVRAAAVDIRYFDTLQLPILAGRTFQAGDVATGNVAVINSVLARNIGGVPLGTRIRYAARGDDQPASPWYEVVGVVQDAGLEVPAHDEVFLPASIARVDPLYFGVHVKGDAAAFAVRLRAIAAEVEPGLRLYELSSLDELLQRKDRLEIQGAMGLMAISLLLMALSAAALYSLMSVAVTRRTREIGIRMALGAGARDVLAAMFGRAAIQVGIGIVIGTALLPSLMTALGITELPARLVIQVTLTASVGMLVTGLVACFVPARRALRIQPTDAVKTTG